MRSTRALSLRQPTEASTSRGVTAAVLGMVPRTVGVLALLLVGSALGGLDQDAVAPPVERPADQARSSHPSAQQPPASRSASSLWREAYSERYPGCVPAVLWPADERPVAVLTRAPDGRIVRVALDDARHPVRPVPAAVRTIGACR